MMTGVCEHGNLERVCLVCEQNAELASLRERLAAAERERDDNIREGQAYSVRMHAQLAAERHARERAEAAWQRAAELANQRLARAERAEAALSRSLGLLNRWLSQHSAGGATDPCCVARELVAESWKAVYAAPAHPGTEGEPPANTTDRKE